ATRASRTHPATHAGGVATARCGAERRWPRATAAVSGRRHAQALVLACTVHAPIGSAAVVVVAVGVVGALRGWRLRFDGNALAAPVGSGRALAGPARILGTRPARRADRRDDASASAHRVSTLWRRGGPRRDGAAGRRPHGYAVAAAVLGQRALSLHGGKVGAIADTPRRTRERNDHAAPAAARDRIALRGSGRLCGRCRQLDGHAHAVPGRVGGALTDSIRKFAPPDARRAVD